MACKFRPRHLFVAVLVCLLLIAPALAYQEEDVVGMLPENLFATQGNTLDDMLDSTTIESMLGRVAADAVLASVESDIAIVNGGDLCANLAAGEVTWGDICAAFPEDRQLAVASITPKQLKAILEGAVSHIVLDETERIDHEASSHGAYPQIAGFTFTYDMSYVPGARVQSIEIGGKTLDLSDDTQSITLAATEYMLSGGYGMPEMEYQALEISLREAFAGYIVQGGLDDDSVTDSDRITIRGTKENELISIFPEISLIAWVVILILVLAELFHGQRLAGNDGPDGLKNFRTK